MFSPYSGRPAKKVYPTLKDNIQHFLSIKTFKNIQISHLNECNIHSYQFFSLMTFLRKTIENLLTTGYFLKNIMPTLNNLNKETKNKASMLNLPATFISESCVKIKINLNVYFHTSLWCLKRFY